MRRIIFIEDTELEAEVIRRLFQTCDRCFHKEIEFTVFGTWSEGEAAIEANPPDAVLLDLTLPDSPMDTTIERMAARALVWPPIIVLTGSEITDELRRRCITFGADDVIFKRDAVQIPSTILERVYTAYLRRRRDRRTP